MRKTLICTLVGLMLLTLPVLAAPEPPAIDSTPDKAVLVHLEGWLDANPVKAGEPPKMQKIFESPRNVVVLINSVGLKLAPHYHTSADEIVVVKEGKGEMLINGEWVVVKEGDIHINPRGAVHATRVADGQKFSVISIFTPPQAGGNDRVAVPQ